MTKFSIAAHRKGQRVAIETLVDDPDYRGVSSASYLDAEAAIRFGEGVAAIGRRILAAGVPAAAVVARPVAVKHMSLAVPSDPHAGDAPT